MEPGVLGTLCLLVCILEASCVLPASAAPVLDSWTLA